MTELTDLTLTEMQAGLLKGRFSSRELVQAALDRMTKLEPSLHAFLHIAGEFALKQADEADKERRSMTEKGSMPLHGIPVAIKDVLTVAGLPCTCGSKILEGFMPPFTGTAVKRLMQAGIIICNGLFHRKLRLWCNA
jgi:aspartyl-tRNA(Asn)/glutamyl-tRNA(Gln) amidotransferase subunit A